MKMRILFTSFATAVGVLGVTLSAAATQVTFDFNGLASGVAATGGPNTIGYTSIQGYMNYTLGLTTPGLTVSVDAGAVTDKAYNGDGHVVGNSTSGTTSITLGTSNNGVLNGNITGCTTTGCSGAGLDTFVRNVSGITSFTFAFNNGLIIDDVKFDYEIFPDQTCATSGCGSNLPDMTFSTNLGQVFHYYGAQPNGSLKSPAHTSGNELTPQAIGNTGFLVANVAGSNILTFMDWPVTIGIDNLTIDYHTSPVPEPASMLLLGTGLAGLYARRRKRQAAKLAI